MASEDMEVPSEGSRSVVGYEGELHRGMGLLGTLSTSFAQQGVMASTALLFSDGLCNGGPAVLFYVWVIGSVKTVWDLHLSVLVCKRSLQCLGRRRSLFGMVRGGSTLGRSLFGDLKVGTRGGPSIGFGDRNRHRRVEVGSSGES